MSTTAPGPNCLLLGKYLVGDVLGEGGMGVVVEATHVELQQAVAIKLLAPHPGREDEMVARFRNEARIAARLPAEHVARALDAGITEDGQPYLVMERLAGRDLDAELEARGRLPISEAVDYILQACEGLAEAHALGLVHRDLKPANLFLSRSRDGEALVKILDFGIATCLPGMTIPETFDGEIIGTPAYMAPEQLDPRAELDARCDQYAIANVLFELISGTTPFFDEDPRRTAAQVVSDEPAPRLASRVPGVPRALDAALARALAKAPAARFPSLAEFARAIAPFGRAPRAAASAERAARALGVDAPGRFARFLGRPRPWASGAAAGAVVAGVVLVGGGALLRDPSVAAADTRPTGHAPRANAPSTATQPAPTVTPAGLPGSRPASPPTEAPPATGAGGDERPSRPPEGRAAQLVPHYTPRGVFGARR